MPHYEIAALPEGFAEAERSIHPASVSVVYMDHAGNTICMDYTFMQQGAATMVVPEDDAATEIFVHTMPGTLFQSDVPGDMHTISMRST